MNQEKYLIYIFPVIEDLRCQRDAKHPLIDVLIFTTCAILCNQVKTDDIIDYR